MRLILLAAALIAALLAAYLAQGLMQAPQPVAVQPPATVDVLVAAKDLVPGEKMASFALEWRPWPRDLVGQSMITKDARPDALETLKEARARLPIVIGEPIADSKIVRPLDRGFMSAVLPQGMRAMAVPVADISAASGFILPNDRVDVLVTRPESSSSLGAQTVVTNVRVLAMNQTLNKGDDPAVPNIKVAVLELEPEQVEIVTQVQTKGALSLVLRSLAEDGDAGVSQKPKLADAFLNPAVIIRNGVVSAIPGQIGSSSAPRGNIYGRISGSLAQ